MFSMDDYKLFVAECLAFEKEDKITNRYTQTDTHITRMKDQSNQTEDKTPIWDKDELTTLTNFYLKSASKQKDLESSNRKLAGDLKILDLKSKESAQENDRLLKLLTDSERINGRLEILTVCLQEELNKSKDKADALSENVASLELQLMKEKETNLSLNGVLEMLKLSKDLELQESANCNEAKQLEKSLKFAKEKAWLECEVDRLSKEVDHLDKLYEKEHHKRLMVEHSIELIHKHVDLKGCPSSSSGS